MVVSALRYTPLEDETRYQMSVCNITTPIFSFHMMTPREIKFAAKKLDQILAGSKFNFEIIGTHVYLTIRR